MSHPQSLAELGQLYPRPVLAVDRALIRLSDLLRERRLGRADPEPPVTAFNSLSVSSR